MGGGGGLIGSIIDTVKGVTGLGTTRAEKQAKQAQQQQAASLMTVKKEEDTKLQERQKRMTSRQRGRASLLSGTELGVTSTEDLKKTLG